MLKSSYKRIKENTEQKANKYSLGIFACASAIEILMLVVNEFGFFHADKGTLRLATCITLFFNLLLILIGRNQKAIVHPSFKFAVIWNSILMTFIICTMMNFHTEILLLFPMLIATQYSSNRVRRIAITGSIATAGIYPVVSYLVESWDTAFLKFLLGTSMHQAVYISPVGYNQTSDMFNILLYMSLPKLLMVAACSSVVVAVGKTQRDNLEYQYKIIQLGETDLLTGLLNRNSYETRVDNFHSEGIGIIGCVYIDANGLHILNDTLGHIAGDELLKCIGQTFQDKFGVHNTYRLGGDEFLVLAENMSTSDIKSRVADALKIINEKGYYAAVGIKVSEVDESFVLADLVNEAEQLMYQDKNRYYKETGKPRRLES